MERYIGLMSGTSADAVDAALVEIGEELSEVTLLQQISQPFQPGQRQEILDLCQPETSSVDALCRWHFRLGEIYAAATDRLLQESALRPEDITAIGLHGQTVYHMPGEGTLQLGSAAVLANAVGIPVVHDFRSADMALGGQGAPLVPFFDQLVFGRDGRTTAVQNLGGIGNVTVVGSGAEQLPAVAFDTGPGNMVMDALAERFSEGKLSYDRDGQWASQGRVHDTIVEQLLQNPYFQKAPPKSTGRELFGRAFVESMLQLANLSREDWLATATAFTAASIADQYQRFILPYVRLEQIVLSGGGSQNPVLRELIAQRTGLLVHLSDEFGVPGQAKEAMAFAVLAAAGWRGIAANVPKATGAKRAARLGSIQYPSPSSACVG